MSCHSRHMGQRRTGLGGKIRQVRLRVGLTQADLARKVGVSERNIVRWENNQHTPRFDHIAAIAEATGEDISFFLEGSDDDDEESEPMSVDLMAAVTAFARALTKASA